MVAYLLVVGVGATVGILVNFPTEQISEDGRSEIVFPQDAADATGSNDGVHWYLVGNFANQDQGLIALALLAGITGSFLQSAQSLIAFIGNDAFKRSWTAWYVLRPWIGAVLGFALYFALRAGLVAGADGVNPHGVVALGLLGGWFSKTTIAKLRETFNTLFSTNANDGLDDGLKRKDGSQANEDNKL